MSYKLYDFSKDPKLDEQIRLLCDILYNHRETYQGQLNAADVEYLQHRILAGGGFGDRWYVPYQKYFDISSVAFIANVLYAFPFFSGNASQVTGVGVYNQVGAWSVRIGLYTNLTDQFHPGALVQEFSVITPAVGTFATATNTAAINPNTLYWITFVASANGSHAGHSISNSVGLAFGYNSTNVTHRPAGRLIVNPFTYGALPATFPTVTTIESNMPDYTQHNIWMRFA